MREEKHRIYALRSWTARWKRRGWYIRRTDSTEHWRGPFANERGACMAIANLLKKELRRRDQK